IEFASLGADTHRPAALSAGSGENAIETFRIFMARRHRADKERGPKFLSERYGLERDVCEIKIGNGFVNELNAVQTGESQRLGLIIQGQADMVLLAALELIQIEISDIRSFHDDPAFSSCDGLGPAPQPTGPKICESDY